MNSTNKNRSGIKHGPEGIKTVGHRTYVGGMWEEIGLLQFNFLIERNLSPNHYLLDIACGSLRGGIHFIRYLRSGHYFGLDKEESLINAGVEQELGLEVYKEKKPVFVVSGDFSFDKFPEKVDFAIAQSLFTHLTRDSIDKCFQRLVTQMKPDGVFYATFFESSGSGPNPEMSHDHANFAYTRQEMEKFGNRNGWKAFYIGGWNHPRNQVIVEYRPEIQQGDS